MASKNKSKKSEVKNKNKSEIIEINDVSIKEYDPDENDDLDLDDEDEEDSYQVNSNRHNKKDDQHQDHHQDKKNKPLLLIFLLLIVLFFGMYHYIFPYFFESKKKEATPAAPKRTKDDLDFINNRKKDNVQTQKKNEESEKPLPAQPLISVPKPLVINNVEEKKIDKQERERKEKEEKEKEIKRLKEDLAKYISGQVREKIKQLDNQEEQKELRECLLFLKESSTQKTGAADRKKVLLDFEKEKKSCQENLETKAESLQTKFETDLENLSITEEKLDIFKREANILSENYRKDFTILIKKIDADYDKLIDRIKKEVEKIKEKEKEEQKKVIQEKTKKIVRDFDNVIIKEKEGIEEYCHSQATQPKVYESFRFLEKEGEISDIKEGFLDIQDARDRNTKKIYEDFNAEINDLSERNEYEKFDEESAKILKKYSEKIKLLAEKVKKDFDGFISIAVEKAEIIKKEKEQREQEEQVKKEQKENEQREQEEQGKWSELSPEEVNEIHNRKDIAWSEFEDEDPKEWGEEWEEVKPKDDNYFFDLEMTIKSSLLPITYIIIWFFNENLVRRKITEGFEQFPKNAKDIVERIGFSLFGDNNYFPSYLGFLLYPLFFLLVWYIISEIVIFLIFIFKSIFFSGWKQFKFKNIILAPFYKIFKMITLFDFLCFLIIFNLGYKKKYNVD